MLTFLIGAASSLYLVHSRWGRPVHDLQTAAVAGFALPIAGALFGGLGSGNLLIAFGADTGSVLADLLVYAWAIAGAGAGFGLAWAVVNWLLEGDDSLESADPPRLRAGRFVRGGATVDDIEDRLVTGPMMPALAGSAGSSGEYTPPSGVRDIQFPF